MNDIIRFLKIFVIPFVFLLISGIAYLLLVIFMDKGKNTHEYLQIFFLGSHASGEKESIPLVSQDSMGLMNKKQDVDRKPQDNTIDSPIKKSQYVVLSRIVNVRKEPSVDSAILYRVYQGDVIEIEGEQNSWGKTIRGYILIDPKNLQKINQEIKLQQVQSQKVKQKEEKNQTFLKYRVVSRIVNIRSEPSSKSSLVGRVYQGEILEIEVVNEYWGKIQNNQQKNGYISLEFIQKISQ